jgi:ABC-type nitrate/sulfonate/bicarbonate transport system permease component
MLIKHIGINVLRYIASLLMLLCVWQGLIFAFHIQPFLLPPPMHVFRTLGSEPGMFMNACAFTFRNMLIGGSLGIGFGLVVAFLLAYFQFARWLAEPYLVIFQSFPRESLLPLMVVWLGFGPASKIANAALLSFFPVAVIVLGAVADTRRDYLELVNSYGANRFQQFLHCRLPNAFPAILAALKVGLPLSLIGAVLGEFMGGSQGLGYLILTSGSAFRVDRVFGAVVILAALGTLLLSIVALFEKTICRRFFQS